MMDFETGTIAVAVSETAEVQETECPIDGDFLLPEYCPDIAAVLKCIVKPAVLSRQWSGETLLVEGQSMLRVLYLDEDRKSVRSFECIQPFSGSIVMPGAATDVLPPVTARVNYINCRAASPRRLGVHGALTIRAKRIGVKEQTVVTDITGEQIYTRQQTVCCCIPAGSAEKVFSISEVVDIGSAKPPAEMLIRYGCTPVITACKQMTDKAIVKGRILLSTLYAVDVTAGTTARAEHEFPFSQILDVEGMEETLQCLTHIDVLSVDVHATADHNGANTLLAVNIKGCIRLDAQRSTQMTVVTDAYSGKFPCETETTRLSTTALQFLRQETSTLKEVLELPSDSMAEIVDLWCETMPVTTRTEQQMSYADGHLQISMLARDRDGSISYYEHVSEYTLQFDDACDRMTAEVSLTGMEYAIIGGKIEIRLELLITRCGYVHADNTVLTAFHPAEQPFPEERAALRICRAKKGQSLWEIAKGCHTAPDAVMEENDLTDDVVPEDMMLLVPLC